MGSSILAYIVPKLSGVQWELYDDLNQVKVYFGVKTFPVRAMKRCYLQKKMCATIRDCRKAFSGY